MIKPFADDGGAFSIGGLSAENGSTSVSISGSVEIGRDRDGLKLARALRSLADALVQALEAAGELPGRATPPTTKPDDDVPNPFA